MRAIEGISQRMLTETLRSLQRDELIERAVLDTAPRSVEYRLTRLGISLLAAMQCLVAWGDVGFRAEVAVAPEVATEARSLIWR